MEKIFKKSLALVLSAALCLTALVGCLTVSAADETTTPIYEMVGAEGKAGETVTVTANLQNIEGICAHHVKFTFAKELTVVSMYDVTRDKPVKFDTDVAEGENFQFKKSIDTNTGVTTVEDVNILNFVKSDNTYDEHTPSLTLTFSVKIADGTADGNYAVNVTATAADQGEAWVNTIDFRNSNVVVKNTVAPDHAAAADWTYDETNHWHACTVVGCKEKFDEAAHTFVKSASEVGVDKYTCECGYSYTVDLKTNLFPLNISYDTINQSVSGIIVYTRAGTKAIAENINALGGTVVDFGTMFNGNGIDPTAETTEFTYARTNNAKGFVWSQMLNTGYNTTIGIKYSGLNFAQMRKVIKFVGFVKYELNGETKYLYSDIKSGTLYDYALTQTDDYSASLVDALNKISSASSNLTNYSTSVENNSIGLTVKYDLATSAIQFVPKYTREGCKEIAAYIDSLGGQITEFGSIFSGNASAELTVENASFTYGRVSSGKAYSWDTMKNTGYNTTLGISYSGMNIAQMNSAIKFRTFVEYIDANGETQYYYPTAEFSYSFMNVISGDTSDLAAALKVFAK